MFSLKDSFYLLIRDERKFYNFMQAIERNYYVYMLGGAVRNYVENGYQYDRNNLPKDFDFIIKYRRGATIKKILIKKHISFNINRFGGYKIKFGKFKIDIWELEDTWAFKNTTMKPTVENIENSVFLNIDAIVYDFGKKIYYKKLYDSAIQNKKISVVIRQEPYVDINALRAIVYSKKYKMNQSKQVKKMIEEIKEVNLERV